MIRRKLLTILFICILLPVIVMFVQSMTTMLSQQQTVTRMSGGYVRNLAEYAADQYNDYNEERIRTFLSLLADSGYNSAISIGEGVNQQQRARTGKQALRSKFIPGLVAYVDSTGNLIAHSQNAAILAIIYERAPLFGSHGRLSRSGSVVSDVIVGGKTLTYVAQIVPTNNPDVFAIAAITLYSWIGKNGFDMMKLAAQGFLSMLAALVALFLLRTYLILPLQSLAAQVNTLKWGSEMLPADTPRKFLGFQVEEITSLKNAIVDLAKRTIEKEELEKRYVDDIVKAQEDERKRIAQDIHDGPIQVVAALTQRIQMTSIDAEGLNDKIRAQLATIESVAQDAVEDLRDICDSLVPPWVWLGIASCLEEAASRFERLYSVKIDVEVDQSLELDQEATLMFYRIFQEAVSNAVRHGGATKIEARLTRTDEEGESRGEHVRLEIHDNGRGFHIDKSVLPKLPLMGKRGLAGMKQRVELLGGVYNLSSEPGKGTVITVEL